MCYLNNKAFDLQIDEMIEKVSYPTYILDTAFVDNYYKQVNPLLIDQCCIKGND